jgi:hypothetical protein
MHEELENFERNQVWVLVDLPQGVSRLRQNGWGRTKRERKISGEKQVKACCSGV